jgi:hypothetical protein
VTAQLNSVLYHILITAHILHLATSMTETWLSSVMIQMMVSRLLWRLGSGIKTKISAATALRNLFHAGVKGYLRKGLHDIVVKLDTEGKIKLSLWLN